MTYLLFIFTVKVFAFDCSSWNWNQQFAEEQSQDSEYKKSLDDFFSSYRIKLHLSQTDIDKTCKALGRSQSENSIQSVPRKVKCVSTAGLSGLENLPCFHYNVIPAKKKSKGTVIRFQGGPADLLQYSRFELADYDVIAFNDIGVGDNSFKIENDFDWKTLDFKNETEIIKRILKQENVKNYVLNGASFGSVSATVIGHELSQSTNPPQAVLLVGVLPAANDRALPTGKDPVVINDTGSPPDFGTDRTCVLKTIRSCADGEILRFLTPSEKAQFEKKMQELKTAEDLKPLRPLFRDALHWEYVRSPERAAQFLRQYILNQKDFSAMNCWYKTDFAEIPWVDRFKTASQMAFYTKNNCFISSPQRRNDNCQCLPDLNNYDPKDYPFQPSIKLFYVNGDSDSQTPLDGAKLHFSGQQTSQKVFLTVCGGGHLPVRNVADKVERTIAADQAFQFIFNGDLKGFATLNNYCNSDEKRQLRSQ